MPKPLVKSLAATTLEGEKNAILSLIAQGEDEHWQLGLHYNRIVDGKLAEKAGFAHARDFFRQELKSVPQSTLSLYGRIAKAFPEAVAKRYGAEKLALLLTYEAQARVHASGGDPAHVRVQVPARSGPSLQREFKECSVAELRAALQRFKKAEPIPAADAKRVGELARSVMDAVGPGGHVGVEALLKGKQTFFKIEMPLASVATVVDALKAAIGK